MSTTNRFGIPLLDANQASQEVTHNIAVIALDALVGLSVPSIVSPSNTPGATTDGNSYLTGPAATGAWASHNNVIAHYKQGWYFFPPVAGMIARGADTGLLYTFSGSAWTSLAGQVDLVQALTDGATVNWNTALGQAASLTIGGNRTLGAPTNLRAGSTYILAVTQDGTGSRTLAYNAVFKWPSGIAPVLSTAAGAKDLLTFYSPDGTNLWGSLMKAFA